MPDARLQRTREAYESSLAKALRELDKQSATLRRALFDKDGQLILKRPTAWTGLTTDGS